MAKQQLFELGYLHGSTGRRTACPTLISKPRYRDGFLAAYRAEQEAA